MIHAGITDNPPWVVIRDDSVGGIEPQLLQRLADSLHATISYEKGSEEVLFGKLMTRSLDVVLGGFAATNPWAKEVAFTRPFYTDTAALYSQGKPPVKHVWAVAPGENAWLVTVEEYLRSNRQRLPQLVEAMSP